MTVFEIAKVVHEIQKAFCESLGDNSLPTWENASTEMKDTVIAGIIGLINDPKAAPGKSHEMWMEKKKADGWVYGPVKNWEKKTHPSLITFRDLPQEEIQKDVLFVQTVRSLQNFLIKG